MLRRSAHIAFLCTGLVLGALAGTTPAEARSASKAAAFVLDANTGAVLYNDDADERRHPASLTKMMTLYLAFETIEQGRMSMSSKVVMSDNAASAAPSKLGLDPGEDLSVREAILALITKSANDVAIALAEKIGGTEQNFVRLMNAKARELGMTKTNFENPSGLPDPNQVSSARDMVTLGLRLQEDFPQHYPLFATRSFRFSGKSHRNHNTLMNNFAGIDGIKTGYTRASGFNLVSSVRRSGRHVVAAVFGGSSAASRNATMRMLLTRALTKASPVMTRKPQPALIAKLKSAPKPAERPAKPKAVAMAAPAPAAAKRPPAPTPRAAQPAPAPAPAPALVAAVEAAPAPEPAAAPAPVAVAKVRKIMVAPRPAKPVTPDETTDMEASAADDASGDAPLPEVRETIVAKTSKNLSLASADAAEGRAAMLGASDLAARDAEAAAPVATAEHIQPEPLVAPAPAQATVEGAAPAVALPAPAPKKAASPAAKVTTASLKTVSNPARDERRPVVRGAPPSSLDAQHAAIATGKPARVAALTPPGGGRFEIQIGAYNSVAEAQRALDAVFARAGGVVANHASLTQPATKDGRQIYRARFRGFDANSAANACGALRKQSFDCFVMTSE